MKRGIDRYSMSLRDQSGTVSTPTYMNLKRDIKEHEKETGPLVFVTLKFPIPMTMTMLDDIHFANLSNEIRYGYSFEVSICCLWNTSGGNRGPENWNLYDSWALENIH